MGKGRATPPLETFVFQGTGIEVKIRKLSALARSEIAHAAERELAESRPVPPLVEVDYGSGKKLSSHEGHEVYQRELREWRMKAHELAAERIVRYAITRGVVVDVDEEAVREARDDMAAAGLDLSSKSDAEVYILYVAVGPYDDYQDLLKAIFERSRPTEEAVQAHIDTFRPDAERA